MTARRHLLFAALAFSLGMPAHAAEPLKIGLVLPFSGPFASYGKQIDHGVRLYLAEHNNMLGGRPVELVVKDDSPGTSGDVSKRLAQEAVIKDKVDILAGFALTPAAFAAAPVSQQAKKPMITMNAATSSITQKSPYIVRASMTLPQTTAPIATWAAKNGIKSAFILVADFGPGYDAEAQFKKTFTAAGGTVVDDVRVPVSNPDYGPFLQRIKDAKPDAVFLFLPPSAGTIAFMKGFKERGLAEAGIKLISTGDLTDEDILDSVGDAAVGLITSFHYAESHASPENKAYTEAYRRAYPNDRPNFMSVGGYDGMALIDQALQKTGGDATDEKFIAAARALSWISPRGPVSIDPDTRDIVQTIYIRRVERVAGRLQNVEFDRVDAFKDPGKE